MDVIPGQFDVYDVLGVTKPTSTRPRRRSFRDSARPRLLDLFCCEGGAGVGYWLAGFDVVGVDIEPRPRYPFEFVQADALEFLAAGGADGFDVVHASPPCQAYSSMRALTEAFGTTKDHPELIEPVREALRALGVPYVIENVPGAPLEEPIRLCGSSFGLDVRRHRLFESNAPLLALPCAHAWQVPRFPVRLGQPNARSNGKDRVNPLSGVVTVVGNSVIADEARRAMGMPWATRDGCSQAIPPAYTEHIGGQLLQALGVTKRGGPARRVEDLVVSRNGASSREVLRSGGAACAVCAGPLPRARTGRPRATCSDRCRQARSRALRAA